MAELQVLNSTAKDGACGAILPFKRVPASLFPLEINSREEDPRDPYSEYLDRGHRSICPMIDVCLR